MIHLRVRTEYSFRRAFGKIANVLAAATANGETVAGIADTGTWGHVAWKKVCALANIRPVYGVEILMVADPADRTKDVMGRNVAFLARSDAGLQELYHLVTTANDPAHFYYVPRVGPREVAFLSDNINVLVNGVPWAWLPKKARSIWAEVNPSGGLWNREAMKQTWFPVVAQADNFFPRVEDREAYEILVGASPGARVGRRTSIMHIPSEEELRLALEYSLTGGVPDEIFQTSEIIARECKATLPRTEMIAYPEPIPLRTMCTRGAKQRGVDLRDKVYADRLTRELEMIALKKFENYFWVITDMVKYAKGTMLVGPARGSAAGSLVCYLLGITDVDPIVHGLMFERFIDITRADLPDIDIDFPDNRREEVMTYLVGKYGAERVGRIGTVARSGVKAALRDVARVLQVPASEIADLQGAIIERSSGDARAQFAVADAFETLVAGRELLKKYPGMRLAGALEGHATHTGTHAAGYIITKDPLAKLCAIDRTGTAQIDKKDAEVLNILKIDVLGLRTLTVLQECLDQIGKERAWLLSLPLDDAKAFDVLNKGHFAGIFQFEGYALQAITKQMGVKEFNDVAVITALARPGPLHSGASSDFVQRRIGNEVATPIHPSCAHVTAETQGVVVYQEQVMSIAREVGGLSWEHVSELRWAMSKSYGDEFFNQYWERFKVGALAKGIAEGEARRVWDNICTFGSWAFNKSHAVSYGLLSYWCAYLKAHYPLEFAVGGLRHAKDEEQTLRLLRELAREGQAIKPVDAEKSEMNWVVKDGVLVGGLTNVKGIGPKKAEQILERRREGRALLPGQARLLAEGKTPYDDLFTVERRWGRMYTHPKEFKIESGNVVKISDVQTDGKYLIIGQLKEKNLRDLNEYASLVKRGGRRIERNTQFLNLILEDDTGSIIASIGRYDFRRWGQAIVDTWKIGEWALWRGTLKGGWRKLNIEKWRKLV